MNPAGSTHASWRPASTPPATDVCRDTGPPKVALICATKGRPDVLRACVPLWLDQTLPPLRVIVVATCDADVDGLPASARVTVIESPAGLTRQRNAGLRALPDETELIVFFDDDFVPDARWLETIAQVFAGEADVVCATGSLLADGINGPGLTTDQALALLAAARDAPPAGIEEHFSPYGCNMAFRRSAVDGISFDERLVLYGWQEDRDFGGMIARRGGRLVKVGAAVGVHLGVKRGRTGGRKLGYSQIVNPLYLMKKGTMRPVTAANHIICNFGANVLGAIAPEPYVDRRGRLTGNILGLRDLAFGVVDPERAERV